MFHVPEKYRILTGRMGSTEANGNNGMFVIPTIEKWDRRQLLVIASDGGGWEHVSIHAEKGRQMLTPRWDEMCYIKDMFWDQEDVVIQLHPAKSNYVNDHPNTLHLWRPVGIEIPTPPLIFV